MSNIFKGFRRVEIPKAIEAAKQLDGVAIYKRTVKRPAVDRKASVGKECRSRWSPYH